MEGMDRFDVVRILFLCVLCETRKREPTSFSIQKQHHHHLIRLYTFFPFFRCCFSCCDVICCCFYTFFFARGVRAADTKMECATNSQFIHEGGRIWSRKINEEQSSGSELATMSVVGKVAYCKKERIYVSRQRALLLMHKLALGLRCVH